MKSAKTTSHKPVGDFDPDSENFGYVEFQSRGAPHEHCTLNCSKMRKISMVDYIMLDRHGPNAHDVVSEHLSGAVYKEDVTKALREKDAEAESRVKLSKQLLMTWRGRTCRPVSLEIEQVWRNFQKKPRSAKTSACEIVSCEYCAAVARRNEQMDSKKDWDWYAKPSVFFIGDVNYAEHQVHRWGFDDRSYRHNGGASPDCWRISIIDVNKPTLRSR